MTHLDLGGLVSLRNTATTEDLITHTYEPEAELALVKATEAIEKSTPKTMDALRRFGQNLTDREFDMLEALFCRARCMGDLSIANPQTRLRVQTALIHGLLNHFDEIFDRPDCRTFLATFAWDDGMTPRDAPQLPMASIRRTVHRTLRGLGLSGIGHFEFDSLRRPLPSENFRRISANAHVICWTRDAAFQPRKTAEALCNSGRFPNMLEIPPVDIVSRALSDARRGIYEREAPDRDQTPRSIAHLGYYLTKAKFATLNRVEALTEERRPKLLPDTKRFTKLDALRLAEIYSHFTPENALFAFGEGNSIKRDYGRIFAATQSSRLLNRQTLDARQISRAFRKIWSAQGVEPARIF